MPVTIGNMAFQALSLALLGAFCRTVYEFRAQIVQCLKSVVTFSTAEETGTGNKRLYDSFLGVALTLGALSAGLGAVKIAAAVFARGTGTPGTIQWKIAGMAGTDGILGMPQWIAPATAIAAAAAVVCVVLAQTGILKAAGSVTLSEQFTDDIVRTKKNSLAAASMLILPLVATWSGVNPQRDRIIMYIAAIVAITIAALFIVHTMRCFLKQKVSLLVWFLYLCTVEIFPVGALTLAAMKNV